MDTTLHFTTNREHIAENRAKPTGYGVISDKDAFKICISAYSKRTNHKPEK